MVKQIRQSCSDALLRMGAERALERQDLERRLTGADPNAPGYHSALAAMAAARAWEWMVLWVGWRLQPRTSAWV
jgi:hypothetical protein